MGAGGLLKVARPVSRQTGRDTSRGFGVACSPHKGAASERRGEGWMQQIMKRERREREYSDA
jgi:hypothetical protein